MISRDARIVWYIAYCTGEIWTFHELTSKGFVYSAIFALFINKFNNISNHHIFLLIFLFAILYLELTWIIHSIVFVQPDFHLSLFAVPKHSRVYFHHTIVLVKFVKAYKCVVQNGGLFLSWQELWIRKSGGNSFSHDLGHFPIPTKPKTWILNINSFNLNLMGVRIKSKEIFLELFFSFFIFRNNKVMKLSKSLSIFVFHEVIVRSLWNFLPFILFDG